MKTKLAAYEDIIRLFHDDMTIMVGGFASIGTPELLLNALMESGAKDLTIITNDTAFPGHGVSRLVATTQIKKLIVSHIGMNPESSKKLNAGEFEVELVPQGTLMDRIRAGGSGLGGILTQTGLGTEVAEGKEIITVDGKEYLLEKPLRAELALLRASRADAAGNLCYKGTTRNFNPLMAFAADTVVAAAECLSDIGTIDGDSIDTPGVLVDYVVGGEIHV